MRDFERVDLLQKEVLFLQETIGRIMSRQEDKMFALIELVNRIVNIEEKRQKGEHA